MFCRGCIFFSWLGTLIFKLSDPITTLNYNLLDNFRPFLKINYESKLALNMKGVEYKQEWGI